MSIYLTYFPLFDFAKEHIYVFTCNTASQSYCNMTADSQWAELYFHTVLGQTLVIETLMIFPWCAPEWVDIGHRTDRAA